MSEIMAEITQAVIIICAVILVKYLVPWIKSRIEATQYARVVDMVGDAVKAAEQSLQGAGRGREKKQTVVKFISRFVEFHGFRVDETEIDRLIESAVYAIHLAEGNK